MDVERLRPKSTKSYRGKLSVSEIADGVEAAFNSAASAYEDAVAAHRAGQNRVAALAYLDVLQEVGRVHALRAMARIHPREQKAWAESWRRSNRHDLRIACALTSVRVTIGGLDDVRELVDEGVRIAAIDSPWFEVLRKRMSYTEFDPASRKWSSLTNPSAEEMGQLSALANLAFDRAVKIREMGLLAESALQIEHEELSSLLFKFHRSLYLRDNEALASLPENPELVSAAASCWVRFQEELGVEFDEADARLVLTT